MTRPANCAQCGAPNAAWTERPGGPWCVDHATDCLAGDSVLAVDFSRSSPNEVAPAAALTTPPLLGEAPLASAPTRHLDYPEAARVIALYLEEFCNPELRYPDMIADAARKAASSLQSERLARETAERDATALRARLKLVDRVCHEHHTASVMREEHDVCPVCAEYGGFKFYVENASLYRAAPHPETRHE